MNPMNVSALAGHLDLAIKASEGGRAEEGYRVGDRVYPAYMTNEEWARFAAAMSDGTREEYQKGSGGEMTEKNGRPPKMASYGSSSRMLYKLSKGAPSVHFEKKLPTSFGGPGANLDGFMEQEERYVFIEAKCREPYHTPYSEENPCEVSAAYEALYTYINAHMDGNLYCRIRPRRADSKSMKVTFESDGATVRYFDVKQMICHLLGIATGLLRGTLAAKRVDFWYLLYDPTELGMAADVQQAIDAVYEETCAACMGIEFDRLFTAVLTYLRDEKGIGHMTDGEIGRYACDFSFTLCSQDFYPFLLEGKF